MKKKLYKNYIFLVAFLYKPFWLALISFCSKKQDVKRVLVFADGTFDSNAMMVLPVANELNFLKIEVWFGFEYGNVKTQYILQYLHPAIKYFSLKESLLIRFFSFYQTSRIRRVVGFLVYPLKILQLLIVSKPNYILVANDIMIPSKTLILFANFLAIPNLSLQHGALCAPFFPLTAEKIGVYSNDVKEFIIKNRWVTEEKMIIVGNPKWDYLHPHSCRNSKKYFKNILILSQAPGYLLDSQKPDKNIEKVFGLVQQLANEFPECKIQVRLHPLEDGSLWKSKIDFIKYHNIMLCNSDEKLLDRLQVTDICISGATTAFYEASLLGVKCIAFRPDVSTIAVPSITEMDSFLFVCTKEVTILKYIKDFYENSIIFSEYENKCPVAYFGNSTKFIAEYIEAVINA